MIIITVSLFCLKTFVRYFFGKRKERKNTKKSKNLDFDLTFSEPAK
jgi:hypothetical protein